MAGMDDYQFYNELNKADNPFWEKSQSEIQMGNSFEEYTRPVNLPQQFTQYSSSPQKKNPAKGNLLLTFIL